MISELTDNIEKKTIMNSLNESERERTSQRAQIMQAIIYTRGSTKGQKETHQAQITNCMEWIAREGLELKSVYSEKISGGASLDKRRALIEAIDDLDQGDILVVTKRSRFGRDLVEIRKAENLVRTKGARVYSLESGFNETANQRHSNEVIDLMNEIELRRISQRTRDVMQHLIKEGRFTGRAPRGFTVEVREDGKKYLVIDPQEQADQEMVKSWKREGFTNAEMIAMCETQGITSRSGKAPSQATISRWTKGVEAPEKAKAERKVSNPNLLGRKARPRLEDQLTGLLPLIQSLLAQGMSYAKITEAVESAGYKTSKGKPIRKSQIGVIVRRHKI